VISRRRLETVVSVVLCVAAAAVAYFMPGRTDVVARRLRTQLVEPPAKARASPSAVNRT
jgi:hypothetical protein